MIVVRRFASFITLLPAHGDIRSSCTADQVADHMIDRVNSGATDGFNIMPAYFPGAFEHFTREVVPRLQARGAFRTEYAEKTLREHLELPIAP
ncbi:hypothetical protein AWV79_04350 [Cupriavidus sp. UYMMa02A]|nr:hypothetical protein AWV79_04350 [Cupriavidus sp. UYMMa02A]